MKSLFSVGGALHGRGPLVFKWHPDGTYLAACGVNKIIHVYDRDGRDCCQEKKITESSAGACKFLEWDRHGEVLACLVENSSNLILWELATRRWEVVDTQMKDPTFMKWSQEGPQLAIGTGKGNLLIFNYKTKKLIPVIGKHTRKITCGAWNAQNRLALGSEDKTVTISDDEGNTLPGAAGQFPVKSEPVDIQFADMKSDDRSVRQESTVSVNVGRKTLFLHNMNDPEEPIELQFQTKYGSIVSYKWYGDGYILVAFSNGYIVVASTHLTEIGGEIYCQKVLPEGIRSMCVSFGLRKAALCSDNSIRTLDLKDWNNIYDEQLQIDVEGQTMDSLDWTIDGQILSVGSKNGSVFNFLARIPVLSAACETQVAYMTSLRELCIMDSLNPDEPARNLTVATEPSLICLGPTHVAIGMNTHVWFYNCTEDDDAKIEMSAVEKTYAAHVQDIKINESYAAILNAGVVQVHPLDMNAYEDEKHFPDRDDSTRVTCMSLTPDFLIYATDRGNISFRHSDRNLVSDDGRFENRFESVCEYRHDAPILALYPNPPGTKLVFVDGTHVGHFYNPVTNVSVGVPKFSTSVNKVIWDTFDPSVFIACDSEKMYTYVFSANTMTGPKVSYVAKSKFRHGLTPISCHNGRVTCQEPSGQLAVLTLESHSCVDSLENLNTRELRLQSFNQLVKLQRLKEAWEAALVLDDRGIWTALSSVALDQMDVDLAIRVFRQLGDAGMVLALQKISDVEDRNLLMGHIALLFSQYDEAQERFLLSSHPVAALEMRRDLLHWSDALKLAKTLAPREIPFISKAYAQQLEFKGEYQQALHMFQKGITGHQDSEHDRSCYAGIARTTIRCGDTAKGISIAEQLKEEKVFAECGAILESMKQMNEAAQLFVKAGNMERAAGIFISIKDFTNATPLMKSVTTPKLHAMYARQKEALNQYEDAAAAFELAKDLDSVVRLCIQKLMQPERAIDIVRKTGSVEGAKIVAKFCESHGDYSAAIEFKLTAKENEEAFALAQAHDAVDTYARCLGDNGTQDEYLAVARFYEGKNMHEQAGDFYAKCGQYHKALKLFLQSANTETRVLDKAIEVVGKANSDMLTHTLIDFLMGETDGVPKDPNYIFRLYLALRKFIEAAKTAIIIARQEQELGNYKMAHDMLFETHKDLEAQNIPVQRELIGNLMLLHSYVLVKTLSKDGNHEGAARLLIRVSDSISKFPAHIVPILTSTVIECKKANFKSAAFKFAGVLMRPEYRKNIDEKYKRKIEGIVRKPDKEGGEEAEAATPCPYCREKVSEYDLECTGCKNIIPYCISTGKHMVFDDWTNCPSCRFPALYSAFSKHISKHKTCPMCNEAVIASAISLNEDPTSLLKKAAENGTQAEKK